MYLVLISESVSIGVAAGPKLMPIYLPLDCDVSIVSQDMGASISLSVFVRGE